MTTYDLSSASVTLKNLISDPSVENGGWSGATVDSSVALYGSKSIKLPSGTTSVPSIPVETPIVGHVYYGRRYCKSDGNNTPADMRFEVFGGDGVGLNWVIAYNNGNHPDWTMQSNRWSVSVVNASSYVVRSFHVNGTANFWQDGFMLIDLTACFGSGNEPTKEWCDSNIPFFAGTMKIAYNVAIKTGDVLNCPYSGSGLILNLKKGTYKLEVWGAQGGNLNQSGSYVSSLGGRGGYSIGTLTLTKATAAFLYAGGQGKGSATSHAYGGFNGGGDAWGSSTGEQANGGGGGSDIRLGQDSLYARVIVAGGGGGAGEDDETGGYGGGTSGGSGGSSYGGQATSASGGGAFGQGAHTSYDGGGGGGGWYGGGTAGGSQTPPTSNSGSDTSGGSGGSGYVYTSSTASQYPSGCLLDSSMYLTNASTVAGNTTIVLPTGSSSTGSQGNGYCRITIIQMGYTATWVADGATVRQDTLSEGDRLSPPNVDKTGYDTSWQVDGVTVDLSTYKMPAKDITLTAVYTAKVIHITYYDSGVISYGTGSYGSSIDLPTGSNGTGKFVGWWDGTNTYASTYTAYADTTLIARYDLVGAKLTLDSISLQPNPVDASATVLLAVTAVMVESSVPRWTGVTFTASDGLPMSSPYQVGIWDTSEGDPMAVFAGKGIKASGRDIPPLQAQTVPLPRCGIWSSGISDANGSISFQITGTVTGGPYTSTIVMLSESTVNVKSATISYDGKPAVAGQCIGSKVTFPKGTYSTFTITITGLSMPYEHVHILNIAPGGSE